MTYLQSLVAGAARVDLDGTPCGEVTAADQEHAAARLAEIQAAREAKRAGAAVEVRKPAWTVRQEKAAAAAAPVAAAEAG